MPIRTNEKFCPRCLRRYGMKDIRCRFCNVNLEILYPEPRLQQYKEHEHKTFLTDELI